MTVMMSQCIRGGAGRGRGTSLLTRCPRLHSGQTSIWSHARNLGPLAFARRGTAEAAVSTWAQPAGVNWRFQVPDGEEICFTDLHLGPQRMMAGRDFGDFIVWRRDDVPAYQLAVVVDDAAMRISEVVRGADLLKSTARQILLCRALGISIPDYYHCDLVRDDAGVRLAKRNDALSIRQLRENGWTPEQVRTGTHLR